MLILLDNFRCGKRADPVAHWVRNTDTSTFPIHVQQCVRRFLGLLLRDRHRRRRKDRQTCLTHKQQPAIAESLE